ncbi:unnamed protein product, partial [Mesorhabditis spiculigera]
MAGDEVRRRNNGGTSDVAATSTPQPEEKVLKNRPKASALRQQRLPAWQPIMTATTVIPAVFCVGIVFIPIGIALYLASDSVVEVRVPYDQCAIQPPTSLATCDVPFTIPKDMTGSVYFYYYLSNFYQNHRRYVKNRNDQQYLGKLDQVSECDPYDKDASGKNIVPCGAIANSMFNDTFILLARDGRQVQFSKAGVVWEVDEQRKFKNPEGWTSAMQCNGGGYENTAKPPNWPKPICEMEDGMTNVDFIVWMRTAALPNFRKLWRTHAPDQYFPNGLPAGDYTLRVLNYYPVASFGGQKEFIMSTTSWAGGKNGFLGVAYLVVGSLAILLGVIFIIIHIKFGHTVDELSNITRQH